MTRTRTGRRYAALFWIGLTALVALVAAQPWDPRLNADEAARQLVAEHRLGEPYRCERDEADQTVTWALGESDYFCEPARYDVGDVSFWVATNGSEITGVAQTAP